MEAKLDDTYSRLFDSTCLLVFFATPHQGGNYATVGDIAATLFNAVRMKSSNDLLPALKKNANEATTRFEQARHLSDKCLVISFFEGESMGRKGLVRHPNIIRRNKC